jgi:peptidoglycan/LPS O-acetylase OafA/YrhL
MRAPCKEGRFLIRLAHSGGPFTGLPRFYARGCTIEQTIAASRTSTGKIPSLDGLRGVSFLIVFVAHAGLEKIVPGRLGVNIFFLLSGYLITTLMIRERQKTGWISLKLFYLRRSLRIFPPMYAIMAATLLYLWLSHQIAGITLAGVSSQAFYYQNYYFRGGKGLIPGLGVLWSLAVEEHFYLFFPPLMLLFLNRFKMNYRQISITLLWICAAILVWRCFVVFHFSNGLEWARDTSDCRADSILFGCALACWEQTESASRMFSRKRLEHIILPASIAILLFTLVFRSPVFRETLRYTLQGIALAPILYYVVHVPGSWVGRILNLRWLAMLGTLSYALYLLHYSVLIAIGQVFHSKVIVGVLSLFVAILLAYLVHIAIEKPTDAMRKRFRHTSNPGGKNISADQPNASLVSAPSAK